MIQSNHYKINAFLKYHSLLNSNVVSIIATSQFYNNIYMITIYY